MQVGILGHYGNSNLGDEAIIEATNLNARNVLGAEEIRLYSIVPADSAFRHNLDAYPVRRGSSPVKAGTAFEPPTREKHEGMRPNQGADPIVAIGSGHRQTIIYENQPVSEP